MNKIPRIQVDTIRGSEVIGSCLTFGVTPETYDALRLAGLQDDYFTFVGDIAYSWDYEDCMPYVEAAYAKIGDTYIKLSDKDIDLDDIDVSDIDLTDAHADRQGSLIDAAQSSMEDR